VIVDVETVDSYLTVKQLTINKFPNQKGVPMYHETVHGSENELSIVNCELSTLFMPHV